MLTNILAIIGTAWAVVMGGIVVFTLLPDLIGLGFFMGGFLFLGWSVAHVASWFGK